MVCEATWQEAIGANHEGLGPSWSTIKHCVEQFKVVAPQLFYLSFGTEQLFYVRGWKAASGVVGLVLG